MVFAKLENKGQNYLATYITLIKWRSTDSDSTDSARMTSSAPNDVISRALRHFSATPFL